MLSPPELSIVESGHLGLMLDYDGTLTPIVSRPEDAVITSERRALLSRLAQLPTIRLAIVSGRSVPQLEAFLGVDLLKTPIMLCGLHGGDIRQYPGGMPLRTPARLLKDAVSHLKERLEAALRVENLLKSVVIEDKTFSLALHYRLTSVTLKVAAVECFETLYRQSGDLQGHFRLQPGKEVLEMVPATFDKGACVRFLAQRWQSNHPEPPLCLTYAGDDLTDEHAFEAACKLGGNAILINGSRLNSHANMHVNSIDRLYEILEHVLVFHSNKTTSYEHDMPGLSL